MLLLFIARLKLKAVCMSANIMYLFILIFLIVSFSCGESNELTNPIEKELRNNSGKSNYQNSKRLNDFENYLSDISQKLELGGRVIRSLKIELANRKSSLDSSDMKYLSNLERQHIQLVSKLRIQIGNETIDWHSFRHEFSKDVRTYEQALNQHLYIEEY